MPKNNEYIEEIINLQLSLHTRRHYKRFFATITAFLEAKYGDKFFLDYSFNEIKALILWIDKQNWSETEKLKHIAALKKLRLKCEEKYLSVGKRYNTIDYAFLFDHKNILQRRFSNTPSSLLEKTYVSVQEWQSLLGEIKEKNPYHYIFIRWFESGCRIGGLVKARLSQLNLQIGYFDTEEKSGRCRYFLPDQFLDDVKWYLLRKNPTNYLFFTMNSDCHYSEVGIRKILHRYTPLNPHDIRRSVMRWFDQAGASESDLCLLSNHTPSMNALYARINPWNEADHAKRRYQILYNKVFF